MPIMAHIHAPKDYKCPICLGINGIESKDTLLRQADLVYKDELVSVFMNSFWINTAEGHLIVVPNKHFENIFELPDDVGHRIFEVTKKMSIAIKKAYECDGITIRQNNEPAANQHAFHFHLHVFPRFHGDLFNENMAKKAILSEPVERLKYVEKLKKVLNND
jgi:histidine triad (HIT) family protein